MAVGWSQARGRMVGLQWHQDDLDKGFAEVDFTEPHGFCCAPWYAELNNRPPPRTPAALLALAKDQMRLARAEEGDDWPCGGRMIVAELTQAGMTISEAGDLEQPARP